MLRLLFDLQKIKPEDARSMMRDIWRLSVAETSDEHSAASWVRHSYSTNCVSLDSGRVLDITTAHKTTIRTNISASGLSYPPISWSLMRVLVPVIQSSEMINRMYAFFLVADTNNLWIYSVGMIQKLSLAPLHYRKNYKRQHRDDHSQNLEGLRSIIVGFSHQICKARNEDKRCCAHDGA